MPGTSERFLHHLSLARTMSSPSLVSGKLCVSAESGLRRQRVGGSAVANKSHLPVAIPTRSKPQSLAYVEKPLSQRWLAHTKRQRLGWVMVPHSHAEDITRAIAEPFDEMSHALYSEGFYEFIHPDLLKGLNDLEKFLVEDICALATGWRKTSITGWEKSRVVIVTTGDAVLEVDKVLTDLFGNLGTKITDYSLLNDKSDDDKRILFALERLQEYVIRNVLKIVRGWK
jgi:hypothetical protein